MEQYLRKASEEIEVAANKMISDNGSQKFTLEEHRWNAGFAAGLLKAKEIVSDMEKRMRKGED